MTRFVRSLADLPAPLGYALVGAIVAGLAGAVAGLVIGLRVYAPTAWAATVELGAPAAVVGYVLGALVGSAVLLVRRVRGQQP
jgi:hypothetical protein